MSENPLVFLTASEIRFGRGKACEVAVTAKGFGPVSYTHLRAHET